MAKRPKTVMLTLRIPRDLRDMLRKAAAADHRSVNNLVVTLLSASEAWASVYAPPRK